MKTEEQERRSALLARLADADEEEPIFVEPSELDLLSASDVPEHARVSVSTLDKKGVRHIEWDGELSIDRGKLRKLTVNLRAYAGD